MYRERFPVIRVKLRTGTVATAQDIYEEATQAVVSPFQSFQKRCPRARPTYWTRELERLTRERKRAYKELRRFSNLQAVREQEIVSKRLKYAICRERLRLRSQVNRQLTVAPLSQKEEAIKTDPRGRK